MIQARLFLILTVIMELLNMNEKKESSIVLKKRHLVIIAVILLLLLMVGVVIGFFVAGLGKDNTQDSSSSQISEIMDKSELEIDKDAKNWEDSKPENKGGMSEGIKIPGYPSITVEKDTKNVKMALLNPEDNPCYFKFEIVLKEKDRIIFQSKLVPPGKVITDVTLTEPLSEGQHPATIRISTLSLDGEQPLNGANVETVLIAK